MKKILVIATVIILVTAIILGILFFINKQTGYQNAKSTSQHVFDFSINLPNNWSGNSYSLTGGESYVATPQTVTPSETGPALILQQFPEDQEAALNQKVENLRKNGYVLRNITVNSQAVSGAQGKLVYLLPGGVVAPAQSPTYDFVSVYPYNGSMYFIEYKYPGSAKDTSFENEFQKIISSIHAQ